MIPRPQAEARARRSLDRSPVTAILGPRQCGKTTLARQLVRGLAHDWFDLEEPLAQQQLATPQIALDRISHLVVIDEIQHRPELFPLLRVIVDREPNRRFLILGSASPDLLKHSSESLAGRIEHIEIGGFDLGEVGTEHDETLWLRGGFPRSYLAQSDDDSLAWRNNFIRTFLERDLPALEVRWAAATLRRAWTMLAHYHGQVWNASEMARSLGISDKTVRAFLDILEGTYLVRVLRPWFENTKKRLVRSPKIYLRDTGILHTLLGQTTLNDVLAHPKCGASWEGYALEQVLRVMPGEPWFWGTHQGAELDLLLMRQRDRIGFEFKRADAPTHTRSMHVAIEDLRLDHLYVVYPGSRRYSLSERTTVVPIAEVMADGARVSGEQSAPGRGWTREELYDRDRAR